MGFFEWLFGSTSYVPGLPEETSPLWATGTLDASLLETWRWLVDERFAPIQCTALGDLFLQGPAGAVYRLDVATGALLNVAGSAEALDEAARDPANFEAWWQPSLVRAVARRERPLGPGECYSWGTPPRLGGRAEVDNLTPRLLQHHFDTHGRAFCLLHRPHAEA